jgi:hypothetical protein
LQKLFPKPLLIARFDLIQGKTGGSEEPVDVHRAFLTAGFPHHSSDIGGDQPSVLQRRAIA